MGNIKIIKGVFDTKLELEHAGVAAGFPSPADEYRHETLDFNRDYIRHPEASFYGDVEGDSMKDVRDCWIRLQNDMGKKAIVIGASSGIGLEVAKILMNQGWTVGVAARRVELLQSIGADAVERIDVTAGDATEALQRLINKLGGMNLFLYASGIGKQNRELTEDIELATVQTNGIGFTRMIGAAYRYFVNQGNGHIAAITSIAGTKGLGPAPAYSATKAMQNIYLQALEQQACSRGQNIRFTDIRPGFVDTALLSGDFRYPIKLRPEKVAREIVSAINLRRHIRIIDWRYRILTALWRRVPRWFWRRIRL